jgi:superfamily I DNA and RNA helicase
MVYAIDSQQAASDFNAVTWRNTLFTAITRSRAWVRVTGWGDRMNLIRDEATTAIENAFRLEFTIPTASELAEMRHVHRDRSNGEEETVKRTTEALSTFLEAVERGEADFFDLPPALRTKLITGLQADIPGDDD